MANVSEDLLSPEHVPESAAPKTGVRRVNNGPLFLIGGAGLVFLIVMALVAADRAEKQNAPAEKQLQQASTSSMLATDVVGSRTEGFIEADKPLSMPEETQPAATTPAPASNPEKPAAPALKVVMPDDQNAPPAPDRRVRDDEADRIRTEKMQRFAEALRAKTEVKVDQQVMGSGREGGSGSPDQSPEDAMRKLEAKRRALQAFMSNSRTDATAAYKAKLAQQREAASGGGGGAGGSGDDSPFMQTASRPGYDEFDKSGDADRWQLKSRAEAPRSTYELRAGFVIPATLISGINSDLPGQIVGQVGQDVYDTATGRYLLIPQGSRLVGSYSSDIAYGQSRIMVAWQRIVFPDGKAMDIGAMPGSDSAGYSGFSDQVNNHLFKLFGSAFLMSGITAGISMSQDSGNSSNNGDRVDASSAMSEALGQQLGQVTAHLIEKNLNVSPTLEIRPGYRFNVVVTKDLDFETPYKSFDYKGRNQ